MRLAGWVAAAFVGFALAASFMDAPARWLSMWLKASSVEGAAEPAAIAARAQPGQVGRLLAARTRALEEFADRCATEQWDQAEELRDAAGRAELQGDRFEAEDFDDQATALYEEARAVAMLSREEGRCLDQSTYEEMPQPNPRDPEKVEEGRELPPGPERSREIEPYRPDLGAEPEELPPPESGPPGPDPELQDEAEAELRSRAAGLAARGDPCGAARLLREQGSAQRTLLLAREFLDRCRRRRAR